MKFSTRAACVALGLLLAAAAAFASGDSESGGWISGSGNVSTENRDVAAFTAIELEGSGNVTVRTGISRAVNVETDDNILPFVKTEVVGNVLHLGFKPDTHVNRMTRLEFTVAAPQLTGITVSGSGNARSAAPLRSDTLSLNIRGSGSITCDADVGGLQATIGGSGGIAVRGRADRLGITINGSGGVHARELSSVFADVRVNGSGDVSVNASNTVNINVSGSGSVEYGGGAKATVRSSGSGSVRKY
jgi:hypothetical protein